MALKNTIQGVRELLEQLTIDLHKAEHHNKAAAQRVRTGTIKLEKLAKVYRKESISEEKKVRASKDKKADAKTAHKKR